MSASGRLLGLFRHACAVEEAAPEVPAEETVDNRIDAAIGRSEPLRHGSQCILDEVPFPEGHRRTEHDPDLDRVQGQPRDGKHGGYDNQHPCDTDLGLLDLLLGLGPSDALDASSPDPGADEGVENEDQGQGKDVAGDEDPKDKPLLRDDPDR